MGWNKIRGQMPPDKKEKKMNDEQLDILLEEATDIKILIALG